MGFEPNQDVTKILHFFINYATEYYFHLLHLSQNPKIIYNLSKSNQINYYLNSSHQMYMISFNSIKKIRFVYI